jgi:hypothetical protein
LAVSSQRRTSLEPASAGPTTSATEEASVVASQSSGVPPTQVLGLPVMSVEEAVAIRDGGRDDRAIAVRGWFSPPLPFIRCRAPQPGAFYLEPYCGDSFAVLMRDPELLVSFPPDGMSARGPTGAHLQVELTQIDTTWYPRFERGTWAPIDIVAIGHFDDRRAGWCEASKVDVCRDRFVVDRVEWADGSTLPISVVMEVEGAFGLVEQSVSSAVPEGRLLSATATVPGVLERVEPSLGEGRPGVTDESVVWSVRVLEGDRSVTYIVPDGTERVYRIETDGRAVQVGGALPADQRPWPPKGVTEVVFPQLSTGHTTKAGVVDRTGLLVEARAATDAERPAGDLVNGTLTITQIDPETIGVYWDGSLCDDRMVLTLYGEGPSQPPLGAQLRGERAQPCRTALVHHGMVLRFSRPVEASTITGGNHMGTPFEAFPPVDSAVVTLPKDAGFIPPRHRAALIDLSGRVTAVRAAQADDPLPRDSTSGRPAYLVPDPTASGRYHLVWTGGICESGTVVTIARDFKSVELTTPMPGNCDMLGHEYRLILDVDGPLDPPAVEVRHTLTSAGAS